MLTTAAQQKYRGVGFVVNIEVRYTASQRMWVRCFFVILAWSIDYGTQYYIIDIRQ